MITSGCKQEQGEENKMDTFALALKHYQKEASITIVNDNAPDGAQEVCIYAVLHDNGELEIKAENEGEVILELPAGCRLWSSHEDDEDKVVLENKPYNAKVLEAAIDWLHSSRTREEHAARKARIEVEFGADAYDLLPDFKVGDEEEEK
jgi:hypothetical protein